MSSQESDAPSTPQRPHGCLTAVIFTIALTLVGILGLVWLTTIIRDLTQTVIPNTLILDLARAVGFFVLVGVPFGLIGLLLRAEGFGLWRGMALALGVLGSYALINGLIMGIDRGLEYPGLPAWLPAGITLIFNTVLLLLVRQRLTGQRDLQGMLASIGVGLLAASAWVMFGSLGLAYELLVAVLEAAATGWFVALMLTLIFLYEPEMPVRRPFWSVLMAGMTFGAGHFALLATRGYWIQGQYIAFSTVLAGLLAGVLLIQKSEQGLRGGLWRLGGFFTALYLLPFAFTEGLEGDWMTDELGSSWGPAVLWVFLATAALLVILAVARRPLASGRRLVAASILLIGIVVPLILYLLLGQPGLQSDTFLVVMADQVDTSFAREIADRDARVTAVYAALTEGALESQADLRALLDARGVPYTPYYLTNSIEVQGGALLRLGIMRRPDVARVLTNPFPRPMHRPAEVIASDPGTALPPPAGLPWGIDQMDAERVWTELGVTGEGIVVGIADSGVDWQHPILRGSYLGSEGNHVYTWLDPWAGSPEPIDTNGHGTHTTGTVAGAEGIGVAPGARWIACRNLAHNLGNPGDYMTCMQFLFAPYPPGGDPFTDGDPTRGAHVTNNSWGCPREEGCDYLTLPFAVNHLRDAGQMMVVSAGNEGPACETVGDPATAEGALSVGALNSSGQLAEFSSRGPVTQDGSLRIKPDVAAPGVDVLSSIPGGDYASYSGTSMAGPHVAGLVALMWSANPALIGDIDTTEQIIFDTATPVHLASDVCGPSSESDNNLVGHGLVNAYEAVQAAIAAGR